MNNVKYTLENNIEFNELCEIVCMVTRQGYTIDDYLADSDNNYIDLYASKEDKSFSINNDGYSISMSGYTPEEALECYKCIVDKIKSKETN